jgi:hypothetical protein
LHAVLIDMKQFAKRLKEVLKLLQKVICFPWNVLKKQPLKVVTNEKGEAVGDVLTIIC